MMDEVGANHLKETYGKRAIKSDIHSLYTLEETAGKRTKSKTGDAVLKGIHGADWDILLTEAAKRRVGTQDRDRREACKYCPLDEEDKGVQPSSFGSIFPVYCDESGKCDEAYGNYLKAMSLMGEQDDKREDSDYAGADWSIPWAVEKLKARSKEGLEEELCEYCSLDEEDRGVHQSSFGSIFPVYCEESGKCEEAYENYLEEVKEMKESILTDYEINENTLSYYEVLAIDKETEEVVVEKRVIAKDRDMAEGKAGLTTIIMNYDYDRSKLAIRVKSLMGIKLLTEEE